MPDLLYQIALSIFPRIGSVTSRKLVAYLGSVETVFNAPSKTLKEVPGIGNAMIKSIIDNRDDILKRAQKEVDFINKYQIKTYFYLDKEYPRRLTQCEDAPVILFQKGNANLNQSKIISIVGTRNSTDYGRELTNELVSGLATSGINVLVVSGLAYGVDIAAHKASLKNNIPTLGVVGHGLDKIYPAAHANFAREMIAAGGGILSDFPSESKIDPGNFPRRNRIVAGISDCTIVIESASKGGALVTADIANSYNRDVFAYPGRTNDIYSAGCNDLIKRNKAAMIESSTDLIEYMGWEANSQPQQQVLLIDLSEDELRVVESLRSNEIGTSDSISRDLSMPVQTVNSLLLNLEFKGILKSLPGNRFKLNSRV